MKQLESPTPEQARAKATAWADRGGPDGRLRPTDRTAFIDAWTEQFLEMELPEFQAY